MVGAHPDLEWCWRSLSGDNGLSFNRSVTRNQESWIHWENDPGYDLSTFDGVYDYYPLAGSGEGLQGSHHYYDNDPKVRDAGMQIYDGVSRWYWAASC